MSEPDDSVAPEVLKTSVLPKAIVAGCVALAVLLAALLAGARYGVLLPQARLLIEARTNGLKLGGLGRLRVEGLSGDLWRDFRVRRLTIRDEKGVWLQAEDVHLQWRYGELLLRRFHADRLEIGRLALIRRPTMGPKGKSSGLPVSFYIDEAKGRVEMLPGFSLERGVYDVVLNLVVRRGGGLRGNLRAASQLSRGDHATAQWDIDKGRPLVLFADAAEAQGGALAGALGLSATKPFLLGVAAGGRTSAGRFNAVILSGAERPLEAAGAWTPEGGTASGRIRLAASTLTAGYAARLGPEVRFRFSGRSVTQDFQDLALEAEAQNLTMRGQGLGNLGERKIGPQGIRLTAATAALSRLTGGPDMGPARAVGVLRPEKDGWRFAGDVSVSRVALGAYALEEAKGPVELAHGRAGWTTKAQIAGRGGRGAGWIAALLGASPKAGLEGRRLADGRLALQELHLAGDGLKLNAAGGRSLMGALTFKGDADLSNLAKARAGAGGALHVTWSAAQSRSSQPWTLTGDAQGAGFSTGYAELDRLLGPKPRLTAQGSVQGRRVAISHANLTGAAMQADAAGVLAGDGGLALKLGWTAQGPFHAGPVEIAGRGSGEGALTGSLAAPKADLTAQLAQVDFPRLTLKNARLTLTFQRQADGSSGRIAATAESAYGPARGRADFRFPQGGVDLSAFSMDAGGVRAEGSLSLRKAAPSAADLTLAAGPGAFLEAGRLNGRIRIIDAPGGARAQIGLTAQGLRTPGSTTTFALARISADGPLGRLPYSLEAQGMASAGRFAADGRGVLTQASPGYQATFEGSGRLGGRDLRTLEPAVLRFGGPERGARLRLASSDGGRIDLDGRFTGDAAEVRAQLQGVGLNLLDEDLAGKMDANLTLGGRGARLDGDLDARLSGARGRGAPASSGVDSVLRGKLANSTLTLDAVASNGQGLKANASVTLPTVTSAAPFRIAVAREQPIRGQFLADGEVRPLWDLLIGGERSLSGRVQTQGTLSGTLAAPRANGQVTVAGGRFDDGATGLSLRQVAIQARFAESGIDVTQAEGVDGRGGTVAGAGRISLAQNGVSSFRLDLHQFRLLDNEQATATATGQATVARAADGRVTLSGALTIDRADVAAKLPGGSGVVAMDVVEKNRPAELVAASAAQRLSAAAAPVGGRGWALDVDLRAPGRVHLKGRGLNLELSLDAHVGGTTSAPSLSGTARVIRGDYAFAGKRFEFDTTSVVYLATRPRDIRLDLSATREDPTLTVVVRIRGTAAKPEITLTSTPSLPRDEVLSQVLFGSSASQLSPVESAQLASAIAGLASGGGLDVIGHLGAFARLDRLAFGGTQASGITVSGGKYVTDKVYLELTGGGREGPIAEAEWRVKRQMSIISRLGGQAGARLSVRWRRDY